MDEIKQHLGVIGFDLRGKFELGSKGSTWKIIKKTEVPGMLLYDFTFQRVDKSTDKVEDIIEIGHTLEGKEYGKL